MENIKEKTNIINSSSFDKTEEERITNNTKKTKIGKNDSKEDAKAKKEKEKKETKTNKVKIRKKVNIKIENEKTDEKEIIDEKPELKEKELEENISNVKNENTKSFLCIKSKYIKTIKKFKKPIISIITAIILSILIIVILYFLKKKKDEKDINDSNQENKPILEENIIKPRIKKEFDILTKPGDLKYISLIQKIKEKQKSIIKL